MKIPTENALLEKKLNKAFRNQTFGLGFFPMEDQHLEMSNFFIFIRISIFVQNYERLDKKAIFVQL